MSFRLALDRSASSAAHPSVPLPGRVASAFLCLMLLPGCAFSQSTASGSDRSVPNLVKFSGSIASAPATSVGAIFALYRDQVGGAPLWQEVQTVSTDASGHYTVLLGSTSSSGIPLDLFGSNEARWLGVQPQGQPEQARILLVSVPYAMKAADAQTLGGLPASAFVRADGSGGTSSGTTYVNTAALTSAAASIAAAPSITTTGTFLQGYVPMFSDSAGDVTDSNLFQAANGNLGLGTTTPQFNMHFIGRVDPAAVTVDGYGSTGVNFIGRRAGGTPLTPTPVTAGSNLLTIQGRGYTGTQFTASSRANIKFNAAENFTDAAQGALITFATTQIGTAPATASERMRITDAGNVGIGTTAPGARLEVNGGIKLTAASGGTITFADGTSQSTAAVGGGGGGVTITSPDSSITVGGTASAPTLVANGGVVQKRVSGTCAAGQAMISVTSTGAVNCGTVGAGGTLANVPQVVANTSFTGNFGLGVANTIYTAAADGFYRVSVYMNVQTPGTCSTPPCQGEAITVQWNDGISTTAINTTQVTPANCNLVTPCGSTMVIPVWVKSGQSISAFGQSWGSGSAPSGAPVYKAYVVVEQL